jgi:hypothetical protein
MKLIYNGEHTEEDPDDYAYARELSREVGEACDRWLKARGIHVTREGLRESIWTLRRGRQKACRSGS